MGLKLRYTLFHGVTAAAVYGAFVAFYEQRGRPLQESGNDAERLDFYRESGDWVVVSLDGGWEMKERREANLFVSRRLWCPGFFVFVYDGDYWGYEFFHHGDALDQFVQEEVEGPNWFPDRDSRGNAAVVVERLPFLCADNIAPYLVQKRDWVIPDGMDIPARDGDQFSRFDECAVLDFLRMLGVLVDLRGSYVEVQSPVMRSAFKIRDLE